MILRNLLWTALIVAGACISVWAFSAWLDTGFASGSKYKPEGRDAAFPILAFVIGVSLVGYGLLEIEYSNKSRKDDSELPHE